MERADGHQVDRADETQVSFAARLRALDDDAWTEFYEQYHLQMWRYAYARTGKRDEADDLAAQVFMEALSSIHRYRDKGRPVLAWLYAIVRNLVSNHRRRARRDATDGDVEPTGASLEERIDSIELAAALERLTGTQRDVVVLRFYAGYSTREIAVAMRKREAAIYSLEVRAIAALRRQFAPGAGRFPAEADKIGPLRGIDKVT
jgi:RNA polymerase sigma-70 factor (ECF subfamily)